MNTPISRYTCPVCLGKGTDDPQYYYCDGDDVLVWCDYTEGCYFCNGVGSFSLEEASIMKLKGHL